MFVTADLSRKLRCLGDFTQFKMRECRNWVNYLLLPTMLLMSDNIVDGERHLQATKDLIKAIRLIAGFSGEPVGQAETQQAQELLNMFCSYMVFNCGIAWLTYKNHGVSKCSFPISSLLMHFRYLILFLRRTTPPWTCSTSRAILITSRHTSSSPCIPSGNTFFTKAQTCTSNSCECFPTPFLPATSFTHLFVLKLLLFFISETHSFSDTPTFCPCLPADQPWHPSRTSRFNRYSNSGYTPTLWNSLQVLHCNCVVFVPRQVARSKNYASLLSRRATFFQTICCYLKMERLSALMLLISSASLTLKSPAEFSMPDLLMMTCMEFISCSQTAPVTCASAPTLLRTLPTSVLCHRWHWKRNMLGNQATNTLSFLGWQQRVSGEAAVHLTKSSYVFWLFSDKFNLTC